ncbi:MAG: NAD(P)H-quinone oxidoreductase subunit 3 [Armatimonadetes bacterium]|nr:NAD(P)H-quinone oxidoreductase subunit 3 [Armatimonadota bacterium]
MLTLAAFDVWPVLVYGGLVLVLVAGMVALSFLLGTRHSAPGRNQPYESGIQPTGSARVRYGISYYLIALFFLLFDVEVAILFAWAVSAQELGWPGYGLAVLFIATLAVGLVYIWKLGGLDWFSDPGRRREQ